jgi:hypothetical protein
MRVLNSPVLAAFGAAIAMSAVSAPVHATPLLANGFSGYYAPDQWKLQTGPAGGSVNTSGAPDSIDIISGNNGAPPLGDELAGTTLFTIRAAQSGTVTFDWSMVIGIGEFFSDQDPFGYFLKGEFNPLSDDLEGDQVGSATFEVMRGDYFGFYAETFNGQFGPSTTTISGFTAPVPGPLPVLGVAAAFRASRKLRVLTRETAKRA